MQGVEPEPFSEGEHLFLNSGKFFLLEKLLPVLRRHGHRVLIFSQSVQALDVLQDFLSFRAFTYERLDGSVRGQERFMAVDRFAQQDTVVFLVSVRRLSLLRGECVWVCASSCLLALAASG